MTVIEMLDGKGIVVGKGQVNMQDPSSGVHYEGELLEFEEFGYNTFISKPQNNGNWPYYWVIEMIDWQEACGEENHRTCVSLSAVSPWAVSKKQMADAIESCGFEETPEVMAKGDKKVLGHIKVEALHQYGVKACLFDNFGGDIEDEDEDVEALDAALMEQAKKVATVATAFTFGFWMDRPMNAIGSTGWDFIKGDIMAGLRKANS